MHGASPARPNGQIAVAEAALEQIPTEHVADIDVLLRVDSAGASHELLEWCREGRIRFSVGYQISEGVRAAILALQEGSWRPEGSRWIVRRERPHPGAQLGLHRPRRPPLPGHPDRPTDPDIAVIERRHRARARVEDQIRADKDTGLSNLPFRDFQMNQVWLELVLTAHDLSAWTQSLVLSGELATAEPKRLRYRLLRVAARLAFSGRRAKLRIQASWPRATELAAAFAQLQALPAPAG